MSVSPVNECRCRLVVLGGGLRRRPLFNSGGLEADDDDDDDVSLIFIFSDVWIMDI